MRGSIVDSTRRRGYGVTFWSAVALLIAPSLYVGMYLRLVQREADVRLAAYLDAHLSERLEEAGIGGFRLTQHKAVYSSTETINSLLAPAFFPAHWADRKIRRNYWYPPPLYQRVCSLLDLDQH